MLHTGHAEAILQTSERASASFFNVSVARDMVGWDARMAYSRCGQIKLLYKGRINVRRNGREGPRQIKQHLSGFIGSAVDIILSYEPAFKISPRSLVVENILIAWVSGVLWTGGRKRYQWGIVRCWWG